MTRFLGLRGSRLNHVALLGVVMPAIMSLGYNQGLLGGVLTMPWFEAHILLNPIWKSPSFPNNALVRVPIS